MAQLAGSLLACCALALLSGCSSAPRTERVGREEARPEGVRPDLARLSKELASRPQPSGHYPNSVPSGMDRDRVLLEILSLLGVPYRYGGNSKGGFDCSGFTAWVYRQTLSTLLPRSAEDQFSWGSSVEAGDLQFGDLVFFSTVGDGPTHVGIYVEDDLFAHASGSAGVTISSLEAPYYRDRFLGAKRIPRNGAER